MIDENTLYINLKFLYQHRCSNKYQDNFIIYPSIHSIQNKNSNKITPKETKYIHQITESVPNTNSYPSNTKISGTVGYKSFNLAAFRFLPDCRSILLRQSVSSYDRTSLKRSSTRIGKRWTNIDRGGGQISLSSILADPFDICRSVADGRTRGQGCT